MSLARRVLLDDPPGQAAANSDALAERRARLVLLRGARGEVGPDDRRRFRIALVIALFAHVLLYLGLQSWTRLRIGIPEETDVIQLRLISPPSDARPASSPVDAGPAATNPVQGSAAIPADSVPTGKPAQGAPFPRQPPHARQDQALAGAAPLNLLDRSGSALLPEQAADHDALKFGRRPRTDGTSRDPMVHQSPLAYHATPFDRYWVADDETLLDEWVRKASRQTSYDTVHGTRITCQVFLFLSACGWGPIPRVSIEELKAMRVSPPLPRHSADDPYVQPVD